MKDEFATPKAGTAETIFNAALAFSAAERPAYLAGACGDNRVLRQRVEALLRAHEAPHGFLPEQPIAAPRSTILVTPLSEAAGTMIGRYKLLELIGEGGFGSVWMAEQEAPVRRRVALKVIKPGMDTKQVLARFESERQALAIMDHPGIARVFDGGATETGRPYFVMELVRGVRITDYCDSNKLSMRERLGLFIQVCQAVQHAHQKGIIHRDLKPSNILVTEVDGAPVPKVIDFGVAKATQARLTELTLFTGLHQMIGTPAYMSPEQAGLGALDMDTRSDIYALGVLLYELLTGQTPITKEDFEKAGMDEIFRLIREQDPPKPSTRLSALTREELTNIAARRQAEPFKLNRLFRGDLDWIVMKALEKDRRRRYETANGLTMDIQRLSSGQFLSFSKDGAPEQAGIWGGRRGRAVVDSGFGDFLVPVYPRKGSPCQRSRYADPRKRSPPPSRRRQTAGPSTSHSSRSGVPRSEDNLVGLRIPAGFPPRIRRTPGRCPGLSGAEYIR
jgi:non-specific serine/threonine protein kinase/serine/threonine-protein kinase